MSATDPAAPTGDAPDATDAGAGAGADRPSGPRRRAWVIGLEVLAAVVPALAFAAWSVTIHVNPMQRIGQISGMAALQLRFAVCAVLLVAGVAAAYRWGSRPTRELVTRLGCAAAAGLATGLVAGGIVVALQGTPFALWAGRDDYVELIRALQTEDLRNLPGHYPPLFPSLMGVWSYLSDQPLAYGLKQLQIAGTAMFGPAAYLSWRLLLRPVWALAVGVVAMLPFIEPVKPYAQITLVMLIPVLVLLLRRLRHSTGLPYRTAALHGAGFGVLLGLFFLLYSGWFVWVAPGVLVAAALLIPWRTGARPALTLGGTALATFLAVSFVHLRSLLSPAGAVSDAFFYFDVCTDPAYIATWFNDRAFYAGPFWPLPGELGGVGLFTVLLAAGAGVALMLGWRRTVVIAIGACILSAWFLRMWIAGGMFERETVQLYPRTTATILYGLLVLTGLGVYFLAEAVRRFVRRDGEDTRGDRLPVPPVAVALIPLLFLFASAGSATINKYMPNARTDSSGWFAWVAHTDIQYGTDDVCSPHAPECGVRAFWPQNTECGPGLAPATQYRSLGADRPRRG